MPTPDDPPDGLRLRRLLIPLLLLLFGITLLNATWESHLLSKGTQIQEGVNLSTKQELPTYFGKSELELSGSMKTSSSTLPQKLFFLHIPKTGTSFKQHLVQYMCPTTNTEEVLGVFASALRAPKALPCTTSIQRGHAPLHTDPNSTVTILRDPLNRIASGFLHRFHDCNSLQEKVGMSMRRDREEQMGPICEDINNNISDSTKGIILEYIHCVAGCSVNMMAGEPCGGPKHGPKATYTPEMEETLESLAYIGMTERWEESVCLFQNVFLPRVQTNQTYIPLSGFTEKAAHYRKNPLEKCESNVKKVILADPELKNAMEADPDWELYNHGEKLFNKRLPPKCAKSQELPNQVQDAMQPKDHNIT